jgi:hypothetical protein
MLRVGGSVLDREPEEANLVRTVPLAIGQLTRNEQVSGSSPLVGSPESALLEKGRDYRVPAFSLHERCWGRGSASRGWLFYLHHCEKSVPGFVDTSIYRLTKRRDLAWLGPVGAPAFS